MFKLHHSQFPRDKTEKLCIGPSSSSCHPKDCPLLCWLTYFLQIKHMSLSLTRWVHVVAVDLQSTEIHENPTQQHRHQKKQDPYTIPICLITIFIELSCHPHHSLKRTRFMCCASAHHQASATIRSDTVVLADLFFADHTREFVS